MLEKIAMWGGVAGIIISLFAIVIIYLTRSNIIDLLDRDVILYDKNYELKKDALESCFNCLDDVAQYGESVKNNPQFIKKAKETYNALLCTVQCPKIYQDFYRYAIDKSSAMVSAEELEKFKILCRGELILHKKKGEGFKGATDLNVGTQSFRSSQPMQTQSQQPAIQVRPMPRPNPRPAQPQQPPRDE